MKTANIDSLLREGSVWVPKTEQAYAWMAANGPLVEDPEIPAWILARLVDRGRVIRLRRGLYAVPGPGGRVDLPAGAVGALIEPRGHLSFYAALTHWGLTDQEARRAGFISSSRHAPIRLGAQTLTFVQRPRGLVRRAGTVEVSEAGLRYRVAEPAKAFIDALRTPELGAAPPEMLRVLETGLATGQLTEDDLVARASSEGVTVARGLGLLLEALTGRTRPELARRVREAHGYTRLTGPEGVLAAKRVPAWMVETVGDQEAIRAAAGVRLA